MGRCGAARVAGGAGGVSAGRSGLAAAHDKGLVHRDFKPDLRNHWDILAVVVQDGALELDNGEVERVIRGPAMGRRNWLFAGSDEGAERAATILTVLETAKRAGVDIREYLRDVLWKVAGGWKQSRLDELLPHVWAARRQSAATSDVELGTSVG